MGPRTEELVLARSASPAWLIARNELTLQDAPFSFGSFGKVYRGTWLKTLVVVKTVNAPTDETKRACQQEAEIWHTAQHLNVVRFFGACQAGSEYWFVAEEAPNGTLPGFLYRQQQAGRSLVWRKLHEVALGLLFLHERGIVHADLKGNNILVSAAGTAVITDFGCAFMPDYSTSQVSTAANGAIRWRAPECLSTAKRAAQAPTFASDVYAFGACIVEAVTGSAPWGVLPDAAVKYCLLKKESFLKRPAAFESDEHWELVKQLCALDPCERLSLGEATDRLAVFAANEEIHEKDTRQQQQQQAS